MLMHRSVWEIIVVDEIENYFSKTCEFFVFIGLYILHISTYRLIWDERGMYNRPVVVCSIVGQSRGLGLHKIIFCFYFQTSNVQRRTIVGRRNVSAVGGTCVVGADILTTRNGSSWYRERIWMDRLSTGNRFITCTCCSNYVSCGHGSHQNCRCWRLCCWSYWLLMLQ